jgi:hypothetical protein
VSKFSPLSPTPLRYNDQTHQSIWINSTGRTCSLSMTSTQHVLPSFMTPWMNALIRSFRNLWPNSFYSWFMEAIAKKSNRTMNDCEQTKYDTACYWFRSLRSDFKSFHCIKYEQSSKKLKISSKLTHKIFKVHGHEMKLIWVSMDYAFKRPSGLKLSGDCKFQSVYVHTFDPAKLCWIKSAKSVSYKICNHQHYWVLQFCHRLNWG